MIKNYMFRGWFAGCSEVDAGWVYGNLMDDGDDEVTIRTKSNGFAVKGRSVGQITSATLDDGTSVYDGDVLEFHYDVPDEHAKTTGVVYYCDTTFSFKVKDSRGEDDPLEEWVCGHAKKVGTAYEDPLMIAHILTCRDVG